MTLKQRTPFFGQFIIINIRGLLFWGVFLRKDKSSDKNPIIISTPLMAIDLSGVLVELSFLWGDKNVENNWRYK